RARRSSTTGFSSVTSSAPASSGVSGASSMISSSTTASTAGSSTGGSFSAGTTGAPAGAPARRRRRAGAVVVAGSVLVASCGATTVRGAVLSGSATTGGVNVGAPAGAPARRRRRAGGGFCGSSDESFSGSWVLSAIRAVSFWRTSAPWSRLVIVPEDGSLKPSPSRSSRGGSAAMPAVEHCGRGRPRSRCSDASTPGGSPARYGAGECLGQYGTGLFRRPRRHADRGCPGSPPREDHRPHARLDRERRFSHSVSPTSGVLMDALDLARWQFGITTVYHFIFVPLTIGLSLLVAIMHTRAVYAKDALRKDAWTRMTKFFGSMLIVNFGIGIATGIVQEFQFGLNWSEYSRYVGDVFGAPLALEGLAAFFLESVFL